MNIDDLRETFEELNDDMRIASLHSNGTGKELHLGQLKRLKQIGKEIDLSKQVYYERVRGNTEIWSATTNCIKCGEWSMWGVRDNLMFTCPKCITKKLNAVHVQP